MNTIQFVLFFIYIGSLLCSGVWIYQLINNKGNDYINKSLYLGEVLLLGSIMVIGELLALSLLKLYSAPFLWFVVLLNYLFLLQREVRLKISRCLSLRCHWDIPLIGFVLLLLFFLFRNCYFLIDVDSHSTYLFAQKLWLENKTSILGNPALDIKVFAPHFNAVPYALTLCFFPQETLFPQLIVAFWMVIVSLLVFGYTSYRFNRWYALSAVMLILFNDHISYSGANKFVIINGALIAFLFAVSYNFLESRKQEGSFRLFLALVFLTQLMANKYQVFYVTCLFFVGGLLIQKDLINKCQTIVRDKKQLFVLLVSVVVLLMWYIKNQLAVGLATFPVFAGRLGVLGWNPEMVSIFFKAYTIPIEPIKFFKYMSYFFVWPGVKAAKIVIMTVSFLPFFLLVASSKRNFRHDRVFELCYWLFISIGVVAGLCFVSFVDPRHYRYGIAILAFTSIFSIDYIFNDVIGLKKRFLIGLVILALSASGYKTIFDQGGAFQRPSLKDNLNVILNKIHLSDVVEKHYPANKVVMDSYQENKEKILNGAWDIGVAGVTPFSAFLLPTRPQVGLWNTTLVRWNSYNDEELIVKDLHEAGLKWIMRVKEQSLQFLSLEEYAKEAVKYDRKPQKIFYNYGFPEELTKVNY